MPRFDVDAAVADGKTIPEIASFLSETHQFDYNKARYDGISDEEIVGFLKDIEVVPKPVQEEDKGGFVASVKNVTGQTIKGIGRVGSDFIPGVDRDNAAMRYGQKLVDENPLAVNEFSDIADQSGKAVAEAVGNAAPSVGSGVTLGVVGKGISRVAPFAGPFKPIVTGVGKIVEFLGPMAIAALPSYSGIRDKQILKDPASESDFRDKAIAALGAGAVGYIEQKFGPQEWAVAALTKEGRASLAEKFASDTILGSIVKGGVRGAAVEGAEEIVQNPIEQAASYDNPLSAESLSDTAFGGAMGAIGGGVLGGGVGGASRLKPTEGANEERFNVKNPSPYDPAQDEAMQWIRVPDVNIPPVTDADFAGRPGFEMPKGPLSRAAATVAPGVPGQQVAPPVSDTRVLSQEEVMSLTGLSPNEQGEQWATMPDGRTAARVFDEQAMEWGPWTTSRMMGDYPVETEPRQQVEPTPPVYDLSRTASVVAQGLDGRGLPVTGDTSELARQAEVKSWFLAPGQMATVDQEQAENLYGRRETERDYQQLFENIGRSPSLFGQSSTPATRDADTGAFLRDQKIRSGAVGRINQPVRRVPGESPDAYMKRRREELEQRREWTSKTGAATSDEDLAAMLDDVFGDQQQEQTTEQQPSATERDAARMEFTAVDGSAADYIVRALDTKGQYTNFARFTVNDKGKPTRVRHFYESNATRDAVELALKRFSVERKEPSAPKLPAKDKQQPQQSEQPQYIVRADQKTANVGDLVLMGSRLVKIKKIWRDEAQDVWMVSVSTSHTRGEDKQWISAPGKKDQRFTRSEFIRHTGVWPQMDEQRAEKPSNEKGWQGINVSGMSPELAFIKQYEQWVNDGMDGNGPPPPSHLDGVMLENFVAGVHAAALDKAKETKPPAPTKKTAGQIDDHVARRDRMEAMSEGDVKALRDKYSQGSDDIRNPIEVKATISKMTDIVFLELKEAKTPQEKYSILDRLSKNLPDSVKIKIGSGQFRDKVDLNSAIRNGGEFSYFELSPRRGYHVATFLIDPTGKTKFQEKTKKQYAESPTITHDPDDESRYYGTRVTIKGVTNNKGSVIRDEKKGTIQRTMVSSGGTTLIEVEPDGVASSFRYKPEDLVIDELVDRVPTEKPVTPETIQQEFPEEIAAVSEPTVDETVKEENERLEELDQETTEFVVRPDIDQFQRVSRSVSNKDSKKPNKQLSPRDHIEHTRKLIKKFVKTVPEFDKAPVFTVAKDKRNGIVLRFTDSFQYDFFPVVFGLEKQNLKVGQHIRIDLDAWLERGDYKGVVYKNAGIINEGTMYGKGGWWSDGVMVIAGGFPKGFSVNQTNNDEIENILKAILKEFADGQVINQEYYEQQIERVEVQPREKQPKPPPPIIKIGDQVAYKARIDFVVSNIKAGAKVGFVLNKKNDGLIGITADGEVVALIVPVQKDKLNELLPNGNWTPKPTNKDPNITGSFADAIAGKVKETVAENETTQPQPKEANNGEERKGQGRKGLLEKSASQEEPEPKGEGSGEVDKGDQQADNIIKESTTPGGQDNGTLAAAGETESPQNDRAGDTGQGAETAQPTATGGESEAVRAPQGQGNDGGLRPGNRRNTQRGAKVGSGADGADTGADNQNQGVVGKRARKSPGVPDYRVEQGGLKRVGSWRETAKRNLDIIELAKKITAENRQATPEEQELLVKYTGFGASEIANNLFPGYARHGRIVDYYAKDEWKPLVERVQELLTKEELETAARSTQYAHYTSEAIIRSIYNAVSRFGFAGGKVVEPGAGVGHFWGLMPDAMFGASNYTAIEMDHLTATIAKLLYPNQNILQADFTKQALPDNFFDIGIGNPPFGDITILSDPAYKKSRFKLHDYFFAKTIDKVRPGGLLVFVTSKGTMDKKDNKARKYIAERADLIGAIRLPQTAFQQNAGTEVVTDVIFLRKRADGEQSNGTQWDALKEVDTEEGKTLVNEYFADNPDMVLGRHSLQGSMYGANEYTVLPIDGDIEDHFAQAVERLPKDVYRSTMASPEAQRAAAIERDFNPKNKKEGGIYLDDQGNIMRVESGSGVALASMMKLDGKQEQWLTDYIGLRDAVKQAQYDQLNDLDWEKSLKALNKTYDSFVKKNGPLFDHTISERTTLNDDGAEITSITKRYKNKKLLTIDVEALLMAALEKELDGGKVEKAPFLLGRTIMKPVRQQPKTMADAMALVLDEIGSLDLGMVAEKMNVSEDEAISALGDLIYMDHSSKQWVSADDYLSGNVRKKLEEAEVAAKSDPSFRRNVEALQKAQPKPLEPKDIVVSLGAPWVSSDIVEEFANDILEINGVSVAYNKDANTWTVKTNSRKSRFAERRSTSSWGTDDRAAYEILSDVLNNKSIRVSRTERLPGGGTKTYTDQTATAQVNDVAGKMRARFSSWVWEDSKRAGELLNIYNEKYNNLAPRKFDGTHLTLPGVSARFKLHDHQKRAIWRAIQDGNTYFAHAVGAGKTIEMIAAGMEMRRLGLIQKPMYVVPKHMLQQFSNEFMELYPLAHIMVADEENFHTDNRRRFMAQAALNNPDAVIITHPSLVKIGANPESVKAVRDEMIDDLRAALDELEEDKQSNRILIKKVEKRIEQLDQMFDAMLAGDKDKVLTFEEMGVDFMFVDEAHEFRKLDFTTNRQAKGIDSQGSKRAIDLYIKTRSLAKNRPGRSHIFASGTPVTNTMGELYTLMRFFDNGDMDADGIGHFDAWASMFGQIAPDFERNAAGNYEMVERFAKFVNVPELMKRVRSFMDILTFSDLGTHVKRPDIESGVPEMVLAPQSAEQKNYLKNVLGPRIETSKKWKPSREQPGNPDPIINIITDGRLASIDMRFVDPRAKNDPTSKLNRMIDGVIESWKETKNLQYIDKRTGKPSPVKGATQVVFYNNGFGAGVKESRGFDARAWMAKRLKDAGIPASEVAWIDDYPTAVKKEAMFNDVRNGKIRILIGSAKKMGTGVNVQNRLKTLHYLDPPWYPSDVEQPHGRILRQGNQNERVKIFWYATEGSYDSTMWQMVSRKAKFIEQAMAGDDSVRTLEDISEVSSYEMASALASGDARVVQLAGLRSDVERLSRLKEAHFDEQNSLRSKKRNTEWAIENQQRRLKQYRDAAQKVGGYIREIEGVIDGKKYDNRTEFGDALAKKMQAYLAQFDDNNKTITREKLGTINGFAIVADAKEKGKRDDVALVVTGDVQYTIADVYNGGTGLTTKFVNKLNGIGGDAQNIERNLNDEKAELEKIKKRLGAPFEYAAELHSRIAEAAQLEAELLAEGKEAEQPAEASDTTQVDMPRRSVTTTQSTGSTVSIGKQEIAGQYNPDRVTIVQSVDELPKGAKVTVGTTGRVQGAYLPGQDRTFLVADNISTGEWSRVLHHEGFHRAMATGSFSDVFSELERMEKMYTGSGQMAKWFEKAREKAQVDRGKPHYIEEIGAYAVSQYAESPKVIQRWVDKLLAKVRLFLRQIGVKVNLTPAMLREIAARGLRAKSVEVEQSGFSGQLAPAFSRPSPQFNPVDVNSAEFKRWFAGSEVVDDEGFGGKSYVAFSPTQIKSAVSNTGEFSDTNPNIRYSVAQPDPVSLENLESVATDMAKAAKKGSIRFIKNSKKDSTFIERLLSTPEYYFKKTSEAAGRVLQAALLRRDVRFEKQQEILGGFVKFIQELRKKNPEAYKEANDYLVETDQENSGFKVRQRDELWVVINAAKKEVSRHESEADAIAAMIKAESDMLKEDGASDAAIEAVRMARELTNRAFDVMAADMRRIIEEAKANGRPNPFIGDGKINEAGRYGVYAAGQRQPIALFATEVEAVEMLGRTSELMSYLVIGAKGNIMKNYTSLLKARAWAAKRGGRVEGTKRFGNLSVKRRTDAEMRPMTVKEALAQMGDLRGTYFPRIRENGEYVLIARKDGANPFRQSFDLPGVGDGNRLQAVLNSVTPIGRKAKELKAQGYDVTISKDTKPTDDVFDATSLITSLDAILQESMGSVDKNDSGEVKAAQVVDQILTMQIADIFKARGYLASRMKRLSGDEVWEGYETDMGKALTQYGKNIAAGTAKRDTARAMVLAFTGRDYTWQQYKSEVEKPSWEEYKKIVEDRRIDPGKQKNLFKDVRGFIVDVLRNDEQTDRIVGTLKGLAVHKFLGFRISSAAVNATNMVTGVVGTMSGKTGESLNRSLRRVMAAATAYTKYRSGVGSISDEDRAIFLEITARGWDEAQFDHEAMSELRSKMGDVWNKYEAASMFMFGAVEKANRAMTIFAALKAVRAKHPTMDEKLQWDMAKEISDTSHGTYGKETLPAMARGGDLNRMLRMPLTFTKFTHNYMLNMIDLGFNKRQWKAASYLLLSPALVAGSGATLAAPLVFALAGALGIGGDDPEEEFYKWSANTFGTDAFARHGLAGLAGVNIKGSLAINMPMPADISKLKLVDIFGPVGGVVGDVTKGAASLAQGDVAKGVELLLPTAFGSMSKAFREHREGVTTSNYGSVFYGDEPLKADELDAALRFLSFNPSRISGIREKQWNEKEVAAKYQERKTAIYHDIKRDHLHGRGLTPEILKEIKRYNELVDGSGRSDISKITPKSIRTMLKRNAKPQKRELERASAMR